MTDFQRDDLIRMVDLPAARLEFRDAGDGDPGIGTLYGYAARFNNETIIDSYEGHFREQIAPGAFRKTLSDRGDKIKVLFNHGFDPSIGDKPLGKPARQEEDDDGLYVEVPLDDTSYNRDLVSSLRSGALDGMSFRFSVVREEEEAPDDKNVLPLRTLKEVRLYEYGPVTFPAYEATTAGVRARAAYQAFRQSLGEPPTLAPPTPDDTPPPAPVIPASERKAALAPFDQILRKELVS